MSRTKYNFFLLAISVFALLSFNYTENELTHPFYVSVSEIRIDDQKQQVTLSCKLFMDDLQDALYKEFKFKADLTRQNEEQDSLLELYIQKRVSINYTTHDIPLIWIGYEIEKEAVWCYFEGSIQQPGNRIEMRNKLLYDFIPKQTNIIHCYLNKRRKSYKLQQPNAVATFEF